MVHELQVVPTCHDHPSLGVHLLHQGATRMITLFVPPKKCGQANVVLLHNARHLYLVSVQILKERRHSEPIVVDHSVPNNIQPCHKLTYNLFTLLMI